MLTGFNAEQVTVADFIIHFIRVVKFRFITAYPKLPQKVI